MHEVEAAKTDTQRHQIEAHLLERGQIYLDPQNPAIRLTEQKTGKPRKIVINKPALGVMQRRLNDHPKHVWLFQSEALNLHKRKPPQAINRRSVGRVFEKVGHSIAPKVALGTHSMRKTRGYAMHKAGRSIESIAKVLNHASASVTMRYIGLV